MWGTALQIALQMLVHVRRFSIDGWRRTPLSGGWDEEASSKSCEYSKRNDSVPGSPRNQMDGPNRFPKDRHPSAQVYPSTGDADNSHCQISHSVDAVKRWKACLEQHDPASMEVRRLCVVKRSPWRKEDCPSHCTELDRRCDASRLT